jgi:hypothetical protein
VQGDEVAVGLAQSRESQHSRILAMGPGEDKLACVAVEPAS